MSNQQGFRSLSTFKKELHRLKSLFATVPCKLHDFLVNNFSFNGDLKNIISHEMLRNYGVNILLILIQLDHLISKKWGFQSISLNQALKFKFKNKQPYFPSKTITDFLLFILKINAKFEATKGHKVEILKTIPPTNGAE